MCLDDEQEVTQLDERDGTGFRNKPRVGVLPGGRIEFGLSVMRGRLTLRETFLLVTKNMPLPEHATRRVRYVRVGILRSAGFEVVHTPSGMVRNHPHCSVVVPGALGELDPLIPWKTEVSEAFDRCFNEEGEEGTANES